MYERRFFQLGQMAWRAKILAAGGSPLRRVIGSLVATRESMASVDLRAAAHPLDGTESDHCALLDQVGNARLVLLGEGSHGTHDFYYERAEITKRLIVEKGFGAVAVEADWPDAYRVNRYVRGEGDDRDANAALSGFERFPTWMWRNTVVLDFVEWLRNANEGRTENAKTGFFGLDLYSLFSSMRTSNIWSASTPRQRSAPAIATRASNISAKTARRTATSRASTCRGLVRMRQ
jgi:erythromycin esterase-like protein